MKLITPNEIKAMVLHLGGICHLGEQHALVGTQPPGFSHGYTNKDDRDAYLIGMARQIKIMRGEAP